MTQSREEKLDYWRKRHAKNRTAANAVRSERWHKEKDHANAIRRSQRHLNGRNKGVRDTQKPPQPRVDKHGYLYVSTASGATRIHVIIMENFLGRRLFSHEKIHHKNAIRSDNRLGNLELWSGWQPNGARVKDKLEWAREIISTYQNSPIADNN